MQTWIKEQNDKYCNQSYQNKSFLYIHCQVKLEKLLVIYRYGVSTNNDSKCEYCAGTKIPKHTEAVWSRSAPFAILGPVVQSIFS